MLPLPPNTMDTGPHPLSKYLNSTVEAVFSVTQPHEEVYLVARIEKVLQGGITTCAEPYMKLGDAVKSTQRILQQVPLLCSRLGTYHMAFAWAARPVFQSGGNKLDLTAEFTALYKQERERLSNEELLKILSDFKNIHKAKLQTIPGSLVVDVVPQPPQSKTATLTSSLLPVRSRGRGGGADRDDTDTLSRVSPSCPPCLEVQEFLGGFHAPRIDPHLSLTHHLYVYPVTLKYDSQKAFAKARNISCWVQFKSSDVKGAKALPVIYSSAPGTVFCDGLHTTVLHHCTSPTFYTEVKLSLPIALSPSHHLLFTFYHISCDIAKTTKAKSSIRQPPPETIVGYAWLPLVDEQGRLLEDTHSLPVAANLPPNYLQFTSSKAAVPDVKWVDGHRPIFRVDTRLQSPIYTQDSSLHEFFSLCEQLKHKSGQLQPAVHTALERLAGVDLHVILQFLPILLTQLFHLLSNSSKDLETLKAEVVRTLVEVVDKVVEAGRSDLLKSYIEHIFVTRWTSPRPVQSTMTWQDSWSSTSDKVSTRVRNFCSTCGSSSRSC
ncbi:Dedicator of cytokinesis protein 11 [Geodia barretti]|uniref:Dedicator of cytokinesis protein 11 n=1 Tax=Geodia barretti TaxID=519541 RepID=A0AA35TLK8_GEOBA|nr:Dedicator of cytokinesis protein 11 [Geodia barretti]